MGYSFSFTQPIRWTGKRNGCDVYEPEGVGNMVGEFNGMPINVIDLEIKPHYDLPTDPSRFCYEREPEPGVTRLLASFKLEFTLEETSESPYTGEQVMELTGMAVPGEDGYLYSQVYDPPPPNRVRHKTMTTTVYI